jgi:Tfp pilus assembly major pilin PilA
MLQHMQYNYNKKENHMATKTLVGKTVTIKAGTRVTVCGIATKRERDSQVTVRAEEAARDGKTRIFWKSCGYTASALIKR